MSQITKIIKTMICTVRFDINADTGAEAWSWVCSANVKTLEEAVDRFYPGYRAALQRIWKCPVESDIKMEVRPNELLHATMVVNKTHIDEMDVLTLFYRERVRQYVASRPKYVIPNNELKLVDIQVKRV